MGRKYKNPPIIEAVCEFRLTPETEWDPTIPGLIYEKISDVFPKKDERVIREVALIDTQEGFQQQISTATRAVFQAEDEKSFVQVGTRLISINCLAPYPTWENFMPKIEMALDALKKTVQIEGLQRTGLRYVNRITIPAPKVDLDEYFDFSPHLGQNLPQDMAGFSLECVISYVDRRDACKVMLTNRVVRDNTDVSNFMLDLDYFLVEPRTISFEDGLSWADEAHSNIQTVFEGCVCDRLRDLFEEKG